MTAIDRFMEDVKHRIAPGLPGAARFEADLTRHLRERVEAGEDEASAVERMGSPGEVVAGFLESVEPPLATPSERLGAFLFDVGLGAAALAAIGILVVWFVTPRVAIVPADLQPPTGAAVDSLSLAGRAAATAPSLVYVSAIVIGVCAVALLLAAILYFPVFETLFGQTAGKRLFGIVVGRDTGERTTLGPAVIRRISFLFDIWPFDAAFLLFTARRQRAFDLAAKTIVFRTEERRIERPWLPVALVWGVAAALAIVIAWVANSAPS